MTKMILKKLVDNEVILKLFSLKWKTLFSYDENNQKLIDNNENVDQKLYNKIADEDPKTEPETSSSFQNRYMELSLILKLLLILFFITIFLLYTHLDLIIIKEFVSIFSFTSTASLNYLCKTYNNYYGFITTSIDESFLNNVTIEDIFRDPFHSPKIFLNFSPKSIESTTRTTAANDDLSCTQNDGYLHNKCSHFSCFDLYRCGLINYNPTTITKHLKNNVLQEKIKVYVYPTYKFMYKNDQKNHEVKLENSLQFNQILLAIVSSPYYTNKPSEACLFIPNIDLLNVDHDKIGTNDIKQILWSLPYYRQMNGSNHLLFMMINTEWDRLKNLDNAMIASGLFNDKNFRLNFDIATPIYSLFSRLYDSKATQLLSFDPFELTHLKRKWTIISTQADFIHQRDYYSLSRLESFFSNRMILFSFNCTGHNDQHLMMNNSNRIRLPFHRHKHQIDEHIGRLYNQTHLCNHDRRMRVRYLDILHDAEFCLIMKSSSAFPLLSDALMSGCIPVIIDDNFIQPFQERIDWTSISIRIREHSLSNLFEVIDSFSLERRKQIRTNVLNIWNRYFRTMENIAITTLDIINERVYPRPKNIHISVDRRFHELVPMSFDFFSKGFNYVSPKHLNLISEGFTTVILTYNRLESLNRVIASVSRVPSCLKILIIWNNQLERPPSNDQWPSIFTPIQVITTSENKLSNRFFPYSSIETEAIFAIDDDITMLNPDEIEFSFQTWREFPDRIVGFPSRLHYWNNMTHSWNYDSEWKNKISLILTGAAFYHHYYNYLYTYLLPLAIRDWVDKHMNCEDIAMNFLVSNITCKAPIKVTPRKKFKCPECTKSNSLSVDVVRHLQLRSYCVDHFANIFKIMPLKAVEFRSDPVLFRDNIPDKFKHFNLIGNL